MTVPNDAPLSREELLALRKVSGSAGTLGFPPVDILRSLRQHGYVRIVLGGVQITPLGQERLLRERNADDARRVTPSAHP